MRPRPRPYADRHEALLARIERHTRETREGLASLELMASDLREHELMKQGRSRTRAFLYNVMLGMGFAVGTVLGLVLLSWLTLHYFQDSAILRDVIRRQLEIRNFDLDRLREEAKGRVDFGGLFGSETSSGSGL